MAVNINLLSDPENTTGMMIQLRHTAVRRLISPPDAPKSSNGIAWALQERIKELNCFYGIAQLAKHKPLSIKTLLEDIVEILPPSWQYPSVACAQITFQGATFKSRNFEISKWQQSSKIFLHHKCAGEITVYYREERPQSFEGPFLSEERALIDAVSEWIGTMAILIDTEEKLQDANTQLTVEQKALQETNTALRTVLARIEDEKKIIHADIHANVSRIIMPILHRLAMELPEAQQKYAVLLKENLENIASPFINQLSTKFHSLTPTEIRICNMIRTGMRTKDIAKIRGVSPATINRHREHIRNKLGIANNSINLTTHLQNAMTENVWKTDM